MTLISQCENCIWVKSKPDVLSKKCPHKLHGTNPRTKVCEKKLTEEEWENRDIIKDKIFDEMAWENVFVMTDGRYIPIPTEEIWNKYNVGDRYNGKHYSLIECSEIRRELKTS